MGYAKRDIVVWSIYIATCGVSGKSYIGITKQIPHRRWQLHFALAKNGSRLPFHLAIQKYGRRGFVFSVLYEAVDAREATAVERGLIAAYGTMAPHGYNLTSGGGGVSNLAAESRAKMAAAKKGRKLSEEHKAKIGSAHKGREQAPQELANLNWLGRKHTPESKAKMSAALTGRKHSDETKMKMSQTRRGRPGRKASPETRAKLSASHKGLKQPAETIERRMSKIRGSTIAIPKSEETRRKISEGNKGKKRTNEARRKISEAARNPSPETRAKLSAAANKRWAIYRASIQKERPA